MHALWAVSRWETNVKGVVLVWLRDEGWWWSMGAISRMWDRQTPVCDSSFSTPFWKRELGWAGAGGPPNGVPQPYNHLFLSPSSSSALSPCVVVRFSHQYFMIHNSLCRLTSPKSLRVRYLGLKIIIYIYISCIWTTYDSTPPSSSASAPPTLWDSSSSEIFFADRERWGDREKSKGVQQI